VAESDASPLYMLECRHSTVCVGCGQNMVKVRPDLSTTTPVPWAVEEMR
jgi:hypothetical protein